MAGAVSRYTEKQAGETRKPGKQKKNRKTDPLRNGSNQQNDQQAGERNGRSVKRLL
jgi:hypothetical protein